MIGGEGVGRGGEKKGNLATRTEFRKNWRRTVRYGLRVLTWRDLSGACESGLKKRKKKKKKKKRKKKNTRRPSNVWMCTLGKYQLGPKTYFRTPVLSNIQRLGRFFFFPLPIFNFSYCSHLAVPTALPWQPPTCRQILVQVAPTPLDPPQPCTYYR